MADDFDLTGFLPYALTQAADALSLEFQNIYKGQYGMLRTEWRVLFHLGQYGAMTAKHICERGRLHKTKVSRAVAALEDKRYLTRTALEFDRRHEELQLTKSGLGVFSSLKAEAHAFDARVRATMTEDEAKVLQRCVMRIAGLETTSP